jgi:UDP-glucose 4-epimerase
VVSDARGAFNIAAEPVIGSAEVAHLLNARPIRVPAAALRAAAAASFALRLQPSEPGWVDMALGVPLMSTERARSELGWSARRTASDAIAELVAGIRDGADDETPPLAASTSGPARVRELLTGLGKRQ